ncbi:MAG: bactofilin family protein [Planctomycetota bacterium]|jgi:DNA-directed RNA polymerase subunit RPC12/RpoP
MARPRSPTTRWILCTQCDFPLEVSAHSKSVNCRHCNSRVITEALDVKDYVAVRRFSTANRMHIKRKGIVYASVRADELVVDGVLEGEAVVLDAIRLGKKARVKANIRAARLAVDAGATLSGDVLVGPDQVPEIGRLQEAAQETQA